MLSFENNSLKIDNYKLHYYQPLIIVLIISTGENSEFHRTKLFPLRTFHILTTSRGKGDHLL